LQICQKTQLSLSLKKYRYVGDIQTFERVPQLSIHINYPNKCI
jgi:hypothetical protein